LDEIIVFGLFVVGVVVILPAYLFFSQLKLKRKVAELEHRVERLITTGGAVQADTTPKEAREPWQPPEAAKVAATAAPIETPAEFVQPEQPDMPASPKNNAFVFSPELVENVTAWLQKNWFFAVAAVSMALAGVFLVQYGVENGLLSPERRVMGAILLGLILIGAGEYIRRKLGSDENGSFALLPSAFAGAGLVSLFAGVLSARMMYGLIGPEMAFVGLALTGGIAVVLGWFYGPLLAIVGVFGALAAPFLVGGDSSSAHLLQLYFAGIAAVALAIDSYKHWAWLSALGLIGAYGAAWLMYLGSGNIEYTILFALIAAGLAVVMPTRQLMPQHDGSMVSEFFSRFDQDKLPAPSAFPTRVAVGAFVASCGMVLLVLDTGAIGFWLSLSGMAALLIAAVVWMKGAPALSDMAFVPAAGLLAIVALEGMDYSPLYQERISDLDAPMFTYPASIYLLLMVGALIAGLLFTWRTWKGGMFRLSYTIVAAAFAPLMAVVLELFWKPDVVLGQANWALVLAVVAIVMTVLSERFSRHDGEDRTRTALFALSAMSMLSFMAFTILGSFALTLALAVQVAASAWMGRQFNMPLLDRYVQLGVLAVSWRLVLIPGVVWGIDGTLWEVVMAFTGSIGLLVAAYMFRRKLVRLGVTVMLESAIWSLTGVFATLMVFRYFDYIGNYAGFLWASMIAIIWLISAANQLYRIRPDVGLRRMRIFLAIIYTILGGFALAISVFGLNPLNGFLENPSISGPYVFDSIFAAYALPGLLMAFVALRFDHVPTRLRKGLGAIGAALMAFYIGLEIRRFWHGDYIGSYQTFNGELYTYTVAMLLVAVLLLVFAFMRKSALLRKLALVAVGLTVAKVYLVDMSGLDGLLRVVSFLVLGLVLAAMAWVNRILQSHENREEE